MTAQDLYRLLNNCVSLHTDNKELELISYVTEQHKDKRFVCYNTKRVPVYWWKIVSSRERGQNELKAVTKQSSAVIKHPKRAWEDSGGKIHTLWKYEVEMVNLDFYVNSFRKCYADTETVTHNTEFVLKTLLGAMQKSDWVHTNINRRNVWVSYDSDGRFTRINVKDWEHSTRQHQDKRSDIFAIGLLGNWVSRGVYSSVVSQSESKINTCLRTIMKEQPPPYRELLSLF
jgi:hypothetical protein